MKKLTFFLMILTLIFLMGCLKKDPLEEFIEKMEKEESAELTMNMDIPFFGKVEVVMELDGNKTHTSEFLFLPETYTEEVDDVTYQYYKEGEDWKKTIYEPTEEDETGMEIVDEIKFEDFIKREDGKYELKEEKQESYQVESLVIEITDYGAIFTMQVKEQGVVLDVVITVKKIGEVKITLPEVSE